MTLCNLNECIISQNFLTPFDYAPSLYKKTSLKKLYNKFSDYSYSNLEISNDVQQYVKNKWIVYGICKDNKIKLIYHRGFVFCEYFNFLHLTVKGKLLLLNFYYDLEDKVKQLIVNYNLNMLKFEQNGLFIHKNSL
jgi:hypothetical protein